MGKKMVDNYIIVLAEVLLLLARFRMKAGPARVLVMLILALVIVICAADLFRMSRFNRTVQREGRKGAAAKRQQDGRIREVVLLDENENPVKSWDLVGKTALLIGRAHPEEDVDVDLEECEFSSLIDFEHAVLNYCRDGWYIEDLYSKHGIRIKKSRDGFFHKVPKTRPYPVDAGDVLVVAKTKLLIM